MVTLQKIRDANHEDLTLIHLGRRMIREDSAEDNGLQIRDGVLNPEQKQKPGISSGTIDLKIPRSFACWRWQSGYL